MKRTFRTSISQTIRKIKLSNNVNSRNLSKEDLLIERLQVKLGKSKEDVSKIISTGLMSLLTMVPISNGK